MTTLRNSIVAALTAAAILTSNAASALSRAAYYYNAGDCPIWSIEISDIDAGVYFEDMLGASTLPAGNGVWLEPDYTRGYCRFDLRVTYTSGQVVTLWDVNLCEALEITTDNYGYTQVGF